MNKYNCFTHKLLTIALTFFSFTSALYAGQVYKWTDNDGVIHYSDTKPANITSKSLKITTGKSSGTRSSAQEQAQTLNETQSKQLAAQAQNLQDETAKRENDARCQTLRDNLVKFRENSRIKTKENGELRYLTPEEIITKTVQYKKMLEDECSE